MPTCDGVDFENLRDKFGEGFFDYAADDDAAGAACQAEEKSLQV